MLLWKLKSLPRKAQFFSRVVIFSACLHLVLLFWMLFMYRGDINQITVSKHLTSGAPIVFVPLYKKINQQAVAQTTMQNGKRAVVKKVTPKKNNQQSKAEKLKMEKKQATTLVHAVQPVKKKKASPVAAKEIKKIELPKEDPPVVKPEEPVKEQEAPAPAVPAEAEEQVLHVGRQEFEALQMQEFINELISTHWEPPVGVSPELVCTVKVVIDWQGAITDVVVAQTSGVLIYDFSARNALQKVATQIVQKQVNLPQWTKGKEFTITFKQ